ncbi:MAG: hypothetical protein MJE63_03305 [Proteobacteria bacterium]|nr:hypothetical protein [Pseudomonadota bacterium]
MSTVFEKKGDNITKAINYIDEQLKSNKDKKLQTLISEAGARFNLTPKDEEYLIRVFKDRK